MVLYWVFHTHIMNIIMVAEFKVGFESISISCIVCKPHLACSCQGAWWYTSCRKNLKACSPEIVSGSSFDEIYEAVKLMVGSYPPHPPPGSVSGMVHDRDVYRIDKACLNLLQPIFVWTNSYRYTVTVRTVWLHRYTYS